MPHIEVLPNSTLIRVPGWTLVPDTGRGLAQVAAQPSAGRKRAARSTNTAGGDTTASQQNAVLKHLADLDKDNQRDVQIAVPVKQKGNAGRTSKKTTSNVRRILMSQKTFANHIDDEVAFLANQPHTAPGSRTLAVVKTTKPVVNLKRSSTSELQSAHGDLSQTTTMANDKVSVVHTDKDPLYDEPLLKSHVPTPPSKEVLEALISAPPLPYNSTRAAPPPLGKPQRHFCEICGYWGTIKCMKCGARVCGLDCKGMHDDGRCLKFYA